jgi:hypothetical protein
MSEASMSYTAGSRDCRRRPELKYKHEYHLLAAMQQLRYPYTTMLEGACDGLFEIRFESGNIQYRPLAYYGPEQGEITILTDATEIGGRLEPPGVCATALARKALAEQDRKYVCPHDLS